MSKKTKILLAVLLLLILIQFKGIDKVNPSYSVENDFISVEHPTDKILNILKHSCYDCHSLETKYPWYTNIAPVSWWIAGHIRAGRGSLNFSDWANYSDEDKRHILKDCVKKVEAKHMPPKSYMMMHKEAKLNDNDRKELENYFRSLLNS